MSGFTNIQMAISPSGGPPAPVIVAFLADDTWVVPVGVTSIDILTVGGGGSGNGQSGTPAVSGGGSGGAVVEVLGVAVTPGDTLSIFVGNGATDGNEDAGGSEVDAPGPVTLAFAPPGVGCNINNTDPAGNGGGGGCQFFVAFTPGGTGTPPGFNGGDSNSDAFGLTFVWGGGGAGAGGDGTAGVSAAGDGGPGLDMTANWGTAYGDSGFFGGGGAAAGYDGVGGTQGSVTTGHGTNSGGGGSSKFGVGVVPLAPEGDAGIVLIKYVP